MRMIRWQKTIGAGVIACMLAGAAVSQARPAPEFSLPDTSGKTHTLAEYKGKYVVLEWTNPDCPFVKKHYNNSGNLPKLQKAYTEKGVIWLSITSSAEGKQGYYTAADWPKVQSDRGAAPTALLLDPAGTVGKAYDAKTTPHMYVINPEGEIIYEGAIDDKATFKAEDIEGAKNYVSEALDAAMAGQPVATAVTPAYGCSVKY